MHNSCNLRGPSHQRMKVDWNENGEMTDYLQRILRARVYDVAQETPWITRQTSVVD